MALVFNLGDGLSLGTGSNAAKIVPIETVILGFFPNNIVTAMSGNVAIPVVIFAIFIAVAFIVESKRNPRES